MQFAGEVEIDDIINRDHPCLAGHFPDNPIVPGVVLLDRVIMAAEQWLSGAQVIALPRVKFLSPLKPGVPFRIVLQMKQNNKASFRCLIDGESAAEGVIDIQTDRAES